MTTTPLTRPAPAVPFPAPPNQIPPGPALANPEPPLPTPRVVLLRHRYPATHEPGAAPPAGPTPAPPRAPEPVSRCTGPEEDAAPPIGRILQVALEVLDGRRPFRHVAAYLDPGPQRYWRAAVGAGRARRSASRLQRVILGRPCPGVAEVAAVCVIAGRHRALAARFEAAVDPDRPTSRWRCTALRLG